MADVARTTHPDHLLRATPENANSHWSELITKKQRLNRNLCQKAGSGYNWSGKKEGAHR